MIRPMRNGCERLMSFGRIGRFFKGSYQALDADVILAVCAATIGYPGDQVLVATQNVGQLTRYCDARLWTTIV